MTGAKKLKISWDYLKGKILTTKEAKKISQNKKKKKKEILVDICFSKGVIQMLIIDLEIYL